MTSGSACAMYFEEDVKQGSVIQTVVAWAETRGNAPPCFMACLLSLRPVIFSNVLGSEFIGTHSLKSIVLFLGLKPLKHAFHH